MGVSFGRSVHALRRTVRAALQQHALEQRHGALMNELQRVQAARQALPDAARAAEVSTPSMLCHQASRIPQPTEL